MIVKKVLKNRTTGTKYIVVPRDSDINAGDYVFIEKLNKEVAKSGDTNFRNKREPIQKKRYKSCK